MLSMKLFFFHACSEHYFKVLHCIYFTGSWLHVSVQLEIQKDPSNRLGS